MHRYRAVAVDYDGTLTDAARPSPDVLAAVADVRGSGLRVILVTGRILDELHEVFPNADDHFDVVVAENGCVLHRAIGTRNLAPRITTALAAALEVRGIDVRTGAVLLACKAADEVAVLEEVRRLGLECQLVRNRSELMVVPTGISKGSGLLEALADLGLSHHDTIAIGDAENDHSLLDVAELGVAVANAVPSLKEQADIVLDEPDGQGVSTALRGGVVVDEARRRPTRWTLCVGVDRDGNRVAIPASQVNVLVAGGTGDGKSYVTGLLAEQLIGLGYSVLVLDPEGDHVGLGELRGVLRVGGDRHLPPPSAVVALLRHRYASVVVDLSELSVRAQDEYLRWLPAEIEAQRQRSGLPHWVVIDEAHRAVGRHPVGLVAFEPTCKGHCLVTWRPGELSADALVAIDVVLALGNPQPDEATVDVTAAIADMSRASIAQLLRASPGRVVVARRRGTPRVTVVQPLDRATVHFRHEHKYSTSGTAGAARFYFRNVDDRLTGNTAGNLGELEDELARCDRSVLRHHCPRHDVSRWVADVFHDTHLGDELREIELAVTEDSPASIVEGARLDLVAALQSRRPH